MNARIYDVTSRRSSQRAFSGSNGTGLAFARGREGSVSPSTVDRNGGRIVSDAVSIDHGEELSNVVDAFEVKSRITEADRRQFAQTLRGLVKLASREDLISFANKVAKNEEMPASVVFELANNDILIARPVLRSSPVLRDDDLIAVIMKHKDEHHLAIAVRDRLSIRVTDHLVAIGSAVTIQAVGRNQGAKFSDKSLRVIVMFIEQTKDDQTARRLGDRADIPEEIRSRLWRVVINSIKSLCENVKKNYMARTSPSFTPTDEKDTDWFVDVEHMVRGVGSRRVVLDECILHLVRNEVDPLEDIASLVARVGGITEITVLKAFVRLHDHSEILKILKGLGCEQKTWSAISEMLGKRHHFSPREIIEMKESWKSV